MKRVNRKVIVFVCSLTPVAACTLSSSAATEPATEPATDAATGPATDAPSDGLAVTIVGSGCPELSTSRAGPSVLVQYKDRQFLVDCGPGSVARLLEWSIDPRKITNMLFTHQHYDHNADYAIFSIGGWGAFSGRRELTLVGPIGTKSLHETLLEFYSKDLDYRIQITGASPAGMRTDVAITELVDEEHTFVIDGVDIAALAVPHTIETYAYRFEIEGQSIVISGDLIYKEKFSSFAKGTDVLVIDATLAGSSIGDVPSVFYEIAKTSLLNSHISNEDIGKIAAKVSPKKLILNHICGDLDLEANIKLYRSAGYKGEVIEAVDGLRVSP